MSKIVDFTAPQVKRGYTYEDLIASGITFEEFARACGIKNCRQWKTNGIPYRHQRTIHRIMQSQKAYKSGLFSFTNDVQNTETQHHTKTNKNNKLDSDFIHSLGILLNSEPTKQSVRELNQVIEHRQPNIQKREASKKVAQAAKEANQLLSGRSQFQENRAKRYIRQNSARSLLFDKQQRVCFCGRHVNFDASEVEIFKNIDGGKAFYKGLQVCGSVWQCPVCAAKISERRRSELVHGTGLHLEKCGNDSLVFVTLTFPHNQYDDLKELMLKLSKATAYFYRHRDYKNLKAKLAKFGYVRALEVTHGSNGWHPHIHEIWFCGRNQSDFYAIKKAVFALWSRACVVAGLSIPNFKHGVDVKDARFAASYVTKFGDDHRKWGMEDELTKSGAKKGKLDKDGLLVSRTPWQLLDAYADDNDKLAGALFRDYTATFKGKQQIRWSNGLKSMYGIQHFTDEQLAEKQESAAYRFFSVSVNDWRIIRQTCTRFNDTRASVLDASESLGYADFEDYIDLLCSRPKRSLNPIASLPAMYGDFDADVELCLSLLQ